MGNALGHCCNTKPCKLHLPTFASFFFQQRKPNHTRGEQYPASILDRNIKFEMNYSLQHATYKAIVTF
ncbi:hypothetical protein GYH30_026948 [Glycine max]|nr:hypothetical protein GYH30_026948 [Glycine max]